MSIYLAVPAGETPAMIDSALDSNQSILELGSGPGRITHELVGMGHTVVAVDDSPEMLEHIVGAETVLADVFSLDLDRTFDLVLAASHLINDPSPERRRALLAVCRKHLSADGTVLVERYPPKWATDPRPGEQRLGEVNLLFEPVEVAGGTFAARVTYELNGRSWVQEFSAAVVTDSMLEREAEAEGLRLVGFLDDASSWASLKRIR